MQAMGGFGVKPVLAVAVSGGPDSMALVLLAQAWVQEHSGHVIALTVDHGLREESAEEVRQTGKWLASRGIEHHTLRWEGDKPAHNIQAQAREARYAMMQDFCRQRGIRHLLTGHQQDDQAESFWLRLARGSGAMGLACMPAIHHLPHVRLLRPLLGIAREELQQWLVTQGQEWIDDPSNHSPRYSRAALREFRPWLDAQGFTPARLAASIESLGEARQVLEIAFARAASEAVCFYPGGFASLRQPAWQALQPCMAVQLLMRLVMVIGGQDAPPRYEDAARLHARMQAREASTLHGTRILWREKAGAWLFLREAARQQKALNIGTGVVWDGRFDAAPLCPEHEGWYIGPADAGMIASIRESSQWAKHPWRMWGNDLLAVLPCVFDLERRPCLPHISNGGNAPPLPLLRPYASQPLCSGPFVTHRNPLLEPELL
jgi:tRNA(Ile)-lysidine synthase